MRHLRSIGRHPLPLKPVRTQGEMDVLCDATAETLLTTPRVVRREEGGSDRLPSVVRVINVAQIAADTLQREQRFVRAAFGYMRDLVMVCDPLGNVILINHAMETFAGLDPVGVLPELVAAYHDLSQPDGTPVAADESPMQRALRGEPVQGMEMVVTSGSGQRCRMVADGERLSDPDGALLGAIVVWRDITEQRAAEERLAFHALHDTLTGLPNRELFIDRVRTALVRAPRYGWSTAVLAINLDHFADMAIRLGDGSADKLLLDVSQRLEVTLRPYDSVARPVDTLARLGGDRFLLLCEDIADEAAATAVANRIEVMLGEPIQIGTDVVRLSAAIGITITRDPDHDPETLILEAETAMRRSRTRGSGRHEPFAPEMRAALRARFADEEALRLALVTEQFYVAYQPKVSLVTEHTVGVEALLRWNHPERGLVSPLDFIPLAEESGLIVPIGAWVLAQVCRDAMRWRKSLPGGRPLMVAVNVSPRQFESGLAETFGNIIDAAGIDPRTVCLEVTESMVMQDAEMAITTLRELKSLGLNISVDDFGTGFSSLAYLKRFPLDELKIDKSFVDGLGRDPEATAIVAAVMGMAHALDLRVVAEGVETSDQASRLRTLGCDQAQGFFYARPGTADDIDSRLRAETPMRTAGSDRITVDSGKSEQIKRVLVVDDADDVRQLARSSLAAVGMEVQESASGEDAITMTRHFRPDCVVLDVNLPGISGFDVCRLLRDDPLNKHMTIVILTGSAEPAEKVMAFSLKADDYMVKPFSPRDLVSRVNAAMRRRVEMLAHTNE
jgi:diguanylate cyclase (GGDEF)-like protein/PAS domain S-box-containing protein